MTGTQADFELQTAQGRPVIMLDVDPADLEERLKAVADGAVERVRARHASQATS
jgi:hypothetical protein